MKRVLIGLVLGTLLALNVASLAAATVSLGQLNAEIYPDALGAEDAWPMANVEYLVC